jgi:hypothetical protein
MWGEAGYPAVPSHNDDLLLHFDQDGVLITSTAAPGTKIFKQVIVFVEGNGKRTTVNPPPRVEEFDGEESTANIKSSRTIYFIGYSGPVDGQTLDQGTNKASKLFGRLHPDASLFQASAPPQQNKQEGIGQSPPESSLLRILLLVFGPYALIGLVGGAWLFLTRRSKWKVRHPYLRRLLVAAYLAVVLTPSMIGDFWLFMIPGPAFAGLTILAPSIVSGENRAATLNIAAIYYMLPMGIVFALAYLGLILHGFRPIRHSSSEVDSREKENPFSSA